MTGKSIILTLTDNSTSMLSIRTKGDSVCIRMHWMFLNADDEVIREIAGFIKARRVKSHLIRQFISKNSSCLKNRNNGDRQFTVRTLGRYHNLQEILDDLNTEYFQNLITASISWGKKNSRRAVRKRTLGSYNGHTNVILINPVLDRKSVPQYYIRFLVYHEMLHSALKEERKNGRRLVHTAEFRRREKKFRYYEEAISWEKKHFT
jgi:predicted metal-dependent hydrolase